MAHLYYIQSMLSQLYLFDLPPASYRMLSRQWNRLTLMVLSTRLRIIWFPAENIASMQHVHQSLLTHLWSRTIQGHVRLSPSSDKRKERRSSSLGYRSADDMKRYSRGSAAHQHQRLVWVTVAGSCLCLVFLLVLGMWAVGRGKASNHLAQESQARIAVRRLSQGQLRGCVLCPLLHNHRQFS